MSEKIKRVIENWKKLVNKNLRKYFSVNKPLIPKELHKAMLYAVFPGGKRIRPILAMASAYACGLSIKKILPVACAIELIHSYSLVHDDLPSMDNDDFRRNKPTVHKKFSEGLAILVGDALLTKAFEIAKRNTKIIKLLSNASGAEGMVGGQVADTFTDFKKLNKKQKEKMLEYIHSNKTGKLIQASIVSAGILANVSSKKLNALKKFGMKIGLAFQIVDDIFDKDKDKLTYPMVYGENKTIKKAENLIKSAKKEIEIFGKRKWILTELADYVIKRKN